MAGIIIFSIIAILCLFYSVMAFQERGPLLTSEYIVSTSEERKKLKTKTEFHFIATVFLGLGILSIVMTVWIATNIKWLSQLAFCIVVIIVIYAVVGSAKSLNRKC